MIPIHLRKRRSTAGANLASCMPISMLPEQLGVGTAGFDMGSDQTKRTKKVEVIEERETEALWSSYAPRRCGRSALLRKPKDGVSHLIGGSCSICGSDKECEMNLHSGRKFIANKSNTMWCKITSRIFDAGTCMIMQRNCIIIGFCR